MGMPRFFRLAKPRQFHYEPIYYDERKEKLQERISQIEHKMGVKLDEYKRTLGKGSFTNYHLRRRKTKTYSTTRLVIILIFLLILSYLLLFF